jgi:hypothetical protein
MRWETKDAIGNWLVCLMPCIVARWLWSASEFTGVKLGWLTPYVFGRAMGLDAKRVK